MSKLSRNRNINLLTEFPCFAYKYSLMVVSKVTPIGILQAFLRILLSFTFSLRIFEEYLIF